MSKETIYKQRKGVSNQRLGEDLMLYDAENDKVHVLNETGALVWELMDGTNTTERIQDILKEKFKDVPAEKISNDTREVLEKLKHERLIDSQT